MDENDLGSLLHCIQLTNYVSNVVPRGNQVKYNTFRPFFGGLDYKFNIFDMDSSHVVHYEGNDELS